MSNKKQLRLLRKLVPERSAKGRVKLWLALCSVFVGTTLLLITVLTWWNARQILSGGYDNDSLGSTFLTLSKEITKQNKDDSRVTVFSYTEIEAINALPQVQDVGVLTSNRFQVHVSLSTSFGFSRDVFIEAVPDRFVDNKPINWVWQYRNITVPIIIPADFLELYNFGFAPNQGDPQLPEATLKALAFDLRLGDSLYTEYYTAKVVGFSHRINSILVPQSFMDYANKTFAPEVVTLPSRLIVKVSDPSNQEFVSFLNNRNYKTNVELLRWSKLRGVIEAAIYTTGLVSLVLILLGAIVYLLFIDITMSKARENITLLKVLGYSPRFLAKYLFLRFLPMLGITYGLSGVVIYLVHQKAVYWLKDAHIVLPAVPGWPVWLALVSCFVLLSLVLARASFKAVRA